MSDQADLLPAIRIGVSSCLLGQEVRYDGGHKHQPYLTATLARYFEFVAYCPEVAIGMGVPRPPIRLVQFKNKIRVVGVKDDAIDVTDALRNYAMQVASQVQDISGYIFKKGSPSCGMERVKVFTEKGMPQKNGRGMFADTLMQCLPLLPMEEEGRLMDPVLRENFIERVFLYRRWQDLLQQGLNKKRLLEFHTRHKFSILAHDEVIYRELGRMVAEMGKGNLKAFADEYLGVVMQAMQKKTTRRKHSNVLMHVMGFLKKQLHKDDKQELLDVFQQYREGLVPLIVPVTLLKHHLRKYPDPYIEQQYYFSPYPHELMLRNSL